MAVFQKVPKKVLIVTSSGGGGLLQAANAKAQEIQSLDPNVIVLQKDVMKDWMWGWAGKCLVGLWNRAQLRGSVRAQSLLGWLAPYAEYLFWPPIFFCSLYTLFKEDVDQVMDTQVLGTSALLKALRVFNWRRKKEVYLEKVLVDLPTQKATHFFTPIKGLGRRDRELFRLITVAPLLARDESEEEFWRKHCNLSTTHLRYEDFYVRQAFRKYHAVERKPQRFVFRTTYQNGEELSLIQKSIQRGSIRALARKGEIEFSIPPEDRLFTLLLGSQPANQSTFAYVKKCIEMAQGMENVGAPLHFFVFCAEHRPGAASLLRKVSEYVQSVTPYPSWLTIVPMSFQSEKAIAPLFFRSEMTCTRSGGQTVMELMCCAKGEMWIHSEAAPGGRELSNEELLKGIPGWESANAAYLQQIRGAKLVTPETFAVHAKELLQSMYQGIASTGKLLTGAINR
jgi:hypothetical protein